MVDNRYATALVIGSVLSLLATVYLSVAVGTQHWHQYRSPPAKHEASNSSELREEFINGDFDEKAYSDTMFRLNGTLGLWWRCILVPGQSHWFKEPAATHSGTHSNGTPPTTTSTSLRSATAKVTLTAVDMAPYKSVTATKQYPKMVTQCVSFTLQQQFAAKYKEPGNHNSGEDMLRTYLWRCQFLLPLVSLALVFLSGLVGVCACLCRSITPTLGVGVLHLLAGLCSLGTVCCFLAGIDILHRNSAPPDGLDGSLGWSLYLCLISSPLQMMAAALFLWAARSHRQNYTRMTAYRVA